MSDQARLLQQALAALLPMQAVQQAHSLLLVEEPDLQVVVVDQAQLLQQAPAALLLVQAVEQAHVQAQSIEKPDLLVVLVDQARLL